MKPQNGGRGSTQKREVQGPLSGQKQKTAQNPNEEGKQTRDKTKRLGGDCKEKIQGDNV